MKYKKILFLMLFTFCLLLTSCKKPQPEKPSTLYHYEFKTLEQIQSMFKSFRINLVFNNNETIDKYDIALNDEGLYYKYNDNQFYIDILSNQSYKISSTNTRSLISNDIISKDSVTKDVFNFLTKHFMIADSNYVKSEDTQNVGGFDCHEYVLEINNDENNTYTLTKFYVSTEGFTVKVYDEAKSSTKGIKNIFTLDYLSYDLDEINELINTFKKYPIKNEVVMYDKWPKTPLGKLLPELFEGTFVIATDDDNRCNIQFKLVSRNVLNAYIERIKNSDFNINVEYTNVSGQIILAGELNYEVYLFMKYTDGQLSILLERLTKEDILNNFEKLNNANDH